MFAVKQMGNGNAGAPDWLFVINGRAVFIELKSPSGKVSKAQKIYHRMLRDRAGVAVHVCRSLEEVEAVIERARAGEDIGYAKKAG